MKRFLFSAALLLCLSTPRLAAAECASAYTPGQLTDDMSAMTEALRNLDEVTFKQIGQKMEARLPCVGRKLPARVYASAYRYIGTQHYLNQDRAAANQWFLTSLELDPTFEWDINDLGPSHPLRAGFDSQRELAAIEPEAIPGKTLLIPAGGALFLDGRELTEAEATPGRPHIFQVISAGDGSLRQSFIIEGNAIPTQFLQDAVEEAAVASTETGRKSRRGGESTEGEIAYGDMRVVYIDRVRPPAKTPLMLAGGAGMMIAGGLYAASFATLGQFDQSSTTADLLRYQSLTNTLVIASGISAVAGVGIGYAGVMMGSGPGVFVGGRF
ncbi:MAG: hypothetical protein ACI8RZ_007679 [Myxococcota bacterium]|jgi:hypothetical protein